MALRTEGFNVSGIPGPPRFPNNLGNIDVKSIYDQVVKGLQLGDQLRTLAANQGLEDQQIQLRQEQAQSQRTALPSGTAADIAKNTAEAAQAPMNTRILATQADTAGQLGNLPLYPRLAVARGTLPLATTKTTQINPATGASVTEESSSLPGGAPGSAGTSISTVQSPPVFKAVFPHTDENGNTTVMTGEFVSDTPGVSPIDVNADGSAVPNGHAKPVGSTSQFYKGYRLAGAAGLIQQAREQLAVGEISQEQFNLIVQGLYNRASATAPVDPNAPKAGSMGEYERTQQQLYRYQQAATQALDAGDMDAYTKFRAKISDAQTRLTTLNQKGTHKTAMQEVLDHFTNPQGAGSSANANGSTVTPGGFKIIEIH